MLKDRNLYNDLYSCGNLRDMIRWQKALKPDFSIEVGSFDATFSFLMSQGSTAAYAFEADPLIYEHWSKVYSGKKNMNYIHKLISNSNKETTFYVKKDGRCFLSDEANTALNNSILVQENYDINNFYAFKCMSITLEEFIYNSNLNNKKFSMWVDAEGVGYEVLEGLGSYIQNLLSLCIEVEACQIWEGQKIDKDIDSYLLNNNFIKYKDYPSTYLDSQYDSIYINKKYLDIKNTAL